MRVKVLLLFTLISLNVVNSQRLRERINFDWKFVHGEIAGAEQPGYNDARWQTVHLPHDASIAGPFVNDSLGSDRNNGFLPRLKGWYRKNLMLSNDIAGKKVFLEFEGVYRDAHVYLNGQHVAHQLNGYEGFMVDVTGIAKPGSNLIAVSYDNTDMESSRWYNGEGIYRDVWLLVTEEVYVDYHGTYVATPIVNIDFSRVFIQTEVVNSRDHEVEVTLKSQIITPDNKVVDEVLSTVPFSPGELYYFRQFAGVNNPKLWDIDSPNLYQVKSFVLVNNEVVDYYETTFGIRTIEFHPDKGMLLNGKKVLIKGVNIHHDLGPLGAAAFERGFERRLESLKILGCNGVRLSHNPHDKAILEWCDRNGMLALSEAFDKWDDQFFGKGNSFEENWEASLKAHLKRDRNHPSVFMWSLGNEPRQQSNAREGFGVPMLNKLADFSRKFEPSRKITAGLHPSRKSGAYRTENYYREGPPEMVFYMDVVSTNYREEFWPVDKASYPQLIFLLSEAQVGNLGNEWFNFNHETSVGLFYWGGTDYIGESFGWPAKGWTNGIIDWNDHWKPFSYYIHSLFADEPMVHVTAYDPSQEAAQYWNEVQLRYQPMFSHWNWEGKDSVKVLTFSNGHEVELFLNRRSLGTKKVPELYYTKDIKAYTAEEYDPENPINTGPTLHKELEWTIPYEPGVIKAVTKIDGKAVAEHELRTAGKPHRIVLEADRDVISADGLDLSYITVKVVDKDGLLVPSAGHEITFSVKGAAVNQAVSSADMISDEPFVSNRRKVFQGTGLLIVRSNREKGKATINATARGLRSAKLEILAQ